MQVSYRNSFWDFIQFNLYQILRSKISLAALGLVFFSVGKLALEVARAIDFSTFGKIVAFSLVLLGGFSLFLLFVLILISSGALLSYFVRKAKRGECKIQATENGLLVESSAVRSEIQWSRINAIKQSKNLILIYMSRQMAYVVPKRAFTQETDANHFFTHISELWGKYKH